jgi:hypothetical protein
MCPFGTGTQCADTLTDWTNCGGCGNRCPEYICTNGVCCFPHGDGCAIGAECCSGVCTGSSCQ